MNDTDTLYFALLAAAVVGLSLAGGSLALFVAGASTGPAPAKRNRHAAVLRVVCAVSSFAVGAAICILAGMMFVGTLFVG